MKENCLVFLARQLVKFACIRHLMLQPLSVAAVTAPLAVFITWPFQHASPLSFVQRSLPPTMHSTAFFPLPLFSWFGVATAPASGPSPVQRDGG